MDQSIWVWIGFTAFVLLMLSIDLGLFSRETHVVTYKQSVVWSVVWITLAMLFASGIFWFSGSDAGLKFLTGYVIELSLSVDNLFVFLLIFSYFKIPEQYQHRVLLWGVLGALIMRAAMIFLGVALINRFHWVIYIFGAFLIFTGIRMLSQNETEINPERNPVIRLAQRIIPLTNTCTDDRFFTRVNGQLHGTLLLLVLIIVEVTDLVFAVDSIPAIFGVTTDPFIIYTSNVFAILGLRTFYFLLANVIEKFHYLKTGLAIVLTFIGVKMLIEAAHQDAPAYVSLHIPTYVSLGVVAIVLAAAVAASLIWPKPSAELQSRVGGPATHA